MAKTIKFNLICDGYPVRSLDELQEHFSIEDVFTYLDKIKQDYDNYLFGEEKLLKLESQYNNVKKVNNILYKSLFIFWVEKNAFFIYHIL